MGQSSRYGDVYQLFSYNEEEVTTHRGDPQRDIDFALRDSLRCSIICLNTHQPQEEEASHR